MSLKGAGIRDRTGAGAGYAKDAGNMLHGVNLEGKLRASKAVALVEKKKLANTLLLVCAGFLSVDRDGRVLFHYYYCCCCSSYYYYQCFSGSCFITAADTECVEGR